MLVAAQFLSGFSLRLKSTQGLTLDVTPIRFTFYSARDPMTQRAKGLLDRVVRKMRVIFSKVEIQNAKKYPKKFSKNAKYHPKCRKNSFRCHGNQDGHRILDWEVGIFMTPCIS